MKRVCLFLFGAALLAPVFSFSATESANRSVDRFEVPATDDGLPGAGPIRRYDWFRNLWRERRTEWAARVEQDKGALVFLGDSITQGWWDVGSIFPGVEIANRGISGDTTRGVLIRLEEDVIALNPSGVVLLIGTNDLEEWGSPENAAENLTLILDRLAQHSSKLPVVLCNVMPSSLTKHRPANQIQKLNHLYADLVKTRPQVSVVDTYSLFADAMGDAPADQFPDLLHPNAAGYARFAAALRPTLEALGLVPAWPDEFTPEVGFESVFNGRDLSGWRVRGAKNVQAGLPENANFRAVNGRFAVTSVPAGGARALVTERTFSKDFVLKLEFRASPNADSGVFVRGVQVQVRDYPRAGPFVGLKAFREIDWNELVITVRGNLARATCNGEVIVDAMTVPNDGPVGIESDRGLVEYRRVRVQER